MFLTPRQERYLAKMTQLVEAIQAEAKKADGKARKSNGKGRKRRSAEDAAKMRAAILAERAKGTSAAKLAAKYVVNGLTYLTNERHGGRAVQRKKAAEGSVFQLFDRCAVYLIEQWVRCLRCGEAKGQSDAAGNIVGAIDLLEPRAGVTAAAM